MTGKKNYTGLNSYYDRTILNPSTLASLAKSNENWNEILNFHSQLASDDYVQFLHDYYKTCLNRFGNHWKYLDVVNVLYAASKWIQPSRYLEIGVRRGRTTCVVAKACPEVSIFGFDMWIPNYANMENPGPDFVKKELKKIGHRGEIKFINGDTHDTLYPFFKDNTGMEFDLITVDGDHTEVGAFQDLSDVIPHLSLGGVIVFDDISHPSHPYLLGVWKKAMAENPQLKAYEYTDSGYGVAFAIRAH